MDFLAATAITAAGAAAGAFNAVVGSGTLITFPTLLALGYPPVLANVSNNIGLVPGVLGGVWGYRRELRGQARRLAHLATASALGGLAGALLLLRLPARTFQAAVPVLILTACALTLAQPYLRRSLDRRTRTPGHGPPGLWAAVCAAGVYGGYFGAAQGIVLIGLLGCSVRESLHRLNAAKNVLAAIVNAVAALVFVAATKVDWSVAAFIALGSTLGGLIGARAGRRLPPAGLRTLIIVVGVAASAVMVLWR
ncbi:sulfite exporter TauE/SafE family protein [Streptomyces sp. NPDC050121]|uniref:sulfite exporter TauE/SafE family protein n=1 Tax=Streptomyces sp. NPDC050121 TaxID=3365601 RepID=UPI0037B15A84